MGLRACDLQFFPMFFSPNISDTIAGSNPLIAPIPRLPSATTTDTSQTLLVRVPINPIAVKIVLTSNSMMLRGTPRRTSESEHRPTKARPRQFPTEKIDTKNAVSEPPEASTS